MKQYRLLNKGEEIRATDEWHDSFDDWVEVRASDVGKKLQNNTAPVRREIILREVIESDTPCDLCTIDKESYTCTNCCEEHNQFKSKKLFTMADA